MESLNKNLSKIESEYGNCTGCYYKINNICNHKNFSIDLDNKDPDKLYTNIIGCRNIFLKQDYIFKFSLNKILDNL